MNLYIVLSFSFLLPLSIHASQSNQNEQSYSSGNDETSPFTPRSTNQIAAKIIDHFKNTTNDSDKIHKTVSDFCTQNPQHDTKFHYLCPSYPYQFKLELIATTQRLLLKSAASHCWYQNAHLKTNQSDPLE